jgi:hypothetical protein
MRGLRPCGQQWLNAARRNPESELASLDNGPDNRHDHDHPREADTSSITITAAGGSRSRSPATPAAGSVHPTSNAAKPRRPPPPPPPATGRIRPSPTCTDGAVKPLR